ncbi:MAG TPA: hypothetical protein DCS12_12415 [Clostridiales bacterium]|nr:hypothetical protein [Clostridiales bacterium]
MQSPDNTGTPKKQIGKSIMIQRADNNSVTNTFFVRYTKLMANALDINTLNRHSLRLHLPLNEKMLSVLNKSKSESFMAAITTHPQ